VLHGIILSFSHEVRIHSYLSRLSAGLASSLLVLESSKGFAVFPVGKLKSKISRRAGIAALGQKQPLSKQEIIPPERLVLGYAGHSPLRISGDASGCFRP